MTVAYRYATEKRNHEDLASGSVLRSAPGLPAFPVRLASEVLQQALAVRDDPRPAVVWDPCCGGGYLLAVLGILHRERIAALVGSDVDDGVLAVARANVGLLSQTALTARAAELSAMAKRYGKAGHGAAVDAASRIRCALAAAGGDLPGAVVRADVFNREQIAGIVAEHAPDIAVIDVPYGEQVEWQGSGGVPGMLASLFGVLPPAAVVAVVARGRVVPAGGFRPVRTLRVGHRAVAVFSGQAGDRARRPGG